tara:strand:+ start:499 stop:828 length:330 start_codon:yes stop_codon:yes gene_type:complete
MKKPALRNNRYGTLTFKENNWTKNAKNIGEYIFRRISLDQSNKNLQNIRPVHQMSKLVITSKEINAYVNDYLVMMEEKNNDAFTEKLSSRLNQKSVGINIDFPEYLGHS